MANLLANIFSTGDRMRRAVQDMLTSPMLHAQKAIGHGIDRSNAWQEDIATAKSKSVLVPQWQKDLAEQRSTNAVVDSIGGAGIIVPVGALQGMTRAKIMEISQQLSQNPAAAYINHGVHRQPGTSQAVKNISDKGQAIPKESTVELFDKVHLKASGRDGKPYKIEDLLDISRYPPDLQEYMRSLDIRPSLNPGAAFYQTGKIELGPTESVTKMTSNLLHELQHGSQYLYDMPRGGNPISFFQDYGRFSTAKMRGEQLMDTMARRGQHPKGDVQAFSQAQGPDDVLTNPDAVNAILGMLKKVDNKAHSQYESISGEVEARLVQRLFEKDDIGIPTQIIKNQMGLNPDNLINPASVKSMPKVDADPVTQSIIRMLIGEK